MESLLKLARETEGADLLLRIGQFLDFAVPVKVFDDVAKRFAQDPEPARQRLEALGLLERHGEDRLALNSLSIKYMEDLSEEQRGTLFRPLLDAIGKEQLEADRQLGLQAFLLAAQAGDVGVLSRVASAAIPELPDMRDPKRTTPLALSACKRLIAENRELSSLALLSAIDQGYDAGEDVSTLISAADRQIQPDEDGLRASFYLREARVLYSQGSPDSALEKFRNAEAKFRELKDKKSLAVTLGEIARIYTGKGDVDRALAMYQEALSVCERLGDVRSRAITLGDIARIYCDQGDFDRALAMHQEELSVYESLGDVRSRAITLGDIARIFTDQGDVGRALEMHQEALSVFDRLGDVRSRAITLGEIARIYRDKGDIDRALAMYQEALSVFDRLGDVRSRAVTLGDIARIYTGKGDYGRALAMYQEVLSVFDNLGDVRSRAMTIGDIARMYRDQGDVDRALAMYQEALTAFERLGDVRSRAITLGRIARIYRDKGDVDRALAMHQEELSVYERLGDVRQVSLCSFLIAFALYKRSSEGDLQSAIELMERSYGLAQQHRFPEADQFGLILNRWKSESGG
jgi:tetratricopeptide (TPR) repeat protein